MNLAITDILSKITLQPSKQLHAFLLTPHHQTGRQSLISFLEEIAVSASAQISERPDLAIGAEKLLRTWTQSQHVEWYGIRPLA